jgi:hypothetical protein
MANRAFATVTSDFPLTAVQVTADIEEKELLNVVYQRGRLADGKRKLESVIRPRCRVQVSMPEEFPFDSQLQIVTQVITEDGQYIRNSEPFILWPSKVLIAKIMMVAG